MEIAQDITDRRLLNDWQRDFPLQARPFAEIAETLGTSETDVMDRLARLTEAGAISRVGATCRPNTAGASTLAAIAAPDGRVDEIARIISAEPGVNHSYLRENAWNIWFVATGPDRGTVNALLGRISMKTGLRVLDLPLVHAFNVDLGFALTGEDNAPKTQNHVDPSVLRDSDRAIIQALSTGLPLVSRPFAQIAVTLGRTEADVQNRIRALSNAGILSRIGVIVRHRALGWRSNAMVVWDLPPERIFPAGTALLGVHGITLCYQRRTVPDVWPYSLYCMIHAKSRKDAMQVLDRAISEVGLQNVPYQVLFSARCFKQIGALVDAPSGAAA